MTAGFEVIVRPVILPNIRPASPRVLVPEDDPSSGVAVLSGSGRTKASEGSLGMVVGACFVLWLVVRVGWAAAFGR